jgi:hypothetical protein
MDKCVCRKGFNLEGLYKIEEGKSRNTFLSEYSMVMKRRGENALSLIFFSRGVEL